MANRQACRGAAQLTCVLDYPLKVSTRRLTVFVIVIFGLFASLAGHAVAASTAINSSAATTAKRATVNVVNTVDTIVADMKRRNDFPLKGYENKTEGWYVGPGQVQLGNIPNLGNAPAHWKKYYPTRGSEELRAILPWIVLFEGPKHSAENTRVQFRNFALYIKSKRKKDWVLLGNSLKVTGYNTPKSNLFGGQEPENKRINADGTVEIKPPKNPNLAWHGWWALTRMSIDPNDIEAVFATVQARLTVDSAQGPDDRAKSQLGIHVGADYYRDPKTNWDIVVPGVGVSRVKQLTSDWQAFNLTSFSDVGVQDPGGGITEAAFRAAPPPLE